MTLDYPERDAGGEPVGVMACVESTACVLTTANQDSRDTTRSPPTVDVSALAGAMCEVNHPVEEHHFDQREWGLLGELADLFDSQRARGEPMNAESISPAHRLVLKKFACLAEFGIWRPSYGPLELPELLDAVAADRAHALTGELAP